MLPRRILVPTDFSPYSEAALDYAVELAKSVGASILLLHVFRPPALDLPEDMIVGIADATGRILESAERTLASSVEVYRSSNVPIETLIEHGVPWRTIVDAAAKLDAPMIVMGTHGRSGVMHALMGSVAEKVVRTATCPVLAIPRARVEVAA